MKHVKFLITLLIIFFIPTLVGAYESSLPINDLLCESVCVGEIFEDKQNVSENFFLSSNISFEDYIVSSCLNFEQVINVSSYNLNIEEFEKKFFDIALRHPELMVITKFTYDNKDHVGYFSPHYLFDTMEKTVSARDALTKKINDYKSLVEDVPTKVGKLTILHDKIAYDYSYEHDYLGYKDKGDYSPYHPISFIMREKAVCQGYTSLLCKVLEEIGIESDFCISDSLSHIWNYVKLDGEWYHTDITWDDQTDYQDDGVTLEKTVYHAYFLRSDGDFVLPSLGSSHGEKTSWTKYVGENYDCTSTKYEKKHLFNVPFATTIFYDGNRFVYPLTSEILLESPTPYVGEIVNSRPYNSIDSSSGRPIICVAHYCIGEAGKEYTTYVKRDADTDVSFKSLKKVTNNKVYINSFLRKQNGDKYSIYYFDTKTLAPLSYSVSFTDN